MHCEELTDDVLLECADRRVNGSALEKIREHLARCRMCAERYLETAQVRELAGLALRATPSRRADARVLRDIDAILAQPKPVAKVRPRRSMAIAALALFSAGATAALILVQPSPRPDPVFPRLALQQLPKAVLPADTVPLQSPPEPVPIIADVADSAPAVQAVPVSFVPILRVEINPKIVDLNGDGKLDVADRMMLVESIGENAPAAQFDMNGDGKVDVADKMLLMQSDPK
jgi:hypothetical protein